MEATNDTWSEMSSWAEQEHKWTNLSQVLLMQVYMVLNSAGILGMCDLIPKLTQSLHLSIHAHDYIHLTHYFSFFNDTVIRF